MSAKKESYLSTVDFVARLEQETGCKVSLRTITGWTKKKGLPYKRQGPVRILIRWSEYVAWQRAIDEQKDYPQPWSPAELAEADRDGLEAEKELAAL